MGEFSLDFGDIGQQLATAGISIATGAAAAAINNAIGAKPPAPLIVAPAAVPAPTPPPPVSSKPAPVASPGGGMWPAWKIGLAAAGGVVAVIVLVKLL